MKANALLQRLVPTLWADEHFLAIAKPAGLDAGGRTDQTEAGLIELVREVGGIEEKLEPINRLSRFESGVLLLGSDPTMVRRLRSELKAGRIQQVYTAVLHGRVPQQKVVLAERKTDAPEPHGRRPTQRRPGRHKTSRTVDPPQRDRSPGALRTSVKALKTGNARTFARCTTNAPTTHALRAQLRGGSLRVFGDTLHSRASRSRRSEQTCLHLTRLTFRHPLRHVPISVNSPVPGDLARTLESIDSVERHLHAALTRRLPILIQPDTDAYRLITGDVEGVRGLVVERLGAVIVLELRGQSKPPPESLKRIARWYLHILGAESVYVRHGPKAKPPSTGETKASSSETALLAGKPAPSEIVIKECGLRYTVRPVEGKSAGIFLDQRDNRSWIRERAQGKSVLNLFAHTCGFSLAAAVGGAASTVSVDLAPAHLEWGERNFALNGLDFADHEFVRADAAGYLERAKRQGRRFDLIILDAPTFAHGRKRKQSFLFSRDMPGLIGGAATLLEAGGSLMVSTNQRSLSTAALKRLVAEGTRRRHRIVASPPLPVDFACDRDHAKTIIARFSGSRSSTSETAGLASRRDD